MKIAQVTPVYPPYRGGIGAVAFEYTERLRARGHDVQVFTPEYRKRTEPPAPGSKHSDAVPLEKGDTSSFNYVHRIKPLIKFGNAAALPSLRTELIGFDVVHLHYPFFGGAEFVAMWKAMGNTPLVTTYHMDIKAGGFVGLVDKTHGAVLRKMVLEMSDKILVSSLDYAKHSKISELVARRLSHVVEMPFGIDADRFQPGAGERIRTKLNIPKNEPVMIFVGGLDRAHYFKGVPVLLKALQRIENIPWHLIVVGSGDLKDSYEETARIHGLENQVHFVGNISAEELPEYYRAADLHVLPSIDRSEAFGIVTVEAAATGIPSVVSDLPGVRSVIEPGKTGQLVKPGDSETLAKALTEQLNDYKTQETMGRAARERAEEKYAWPKLMDRLESIYADLHHN